MAGDLVSLSEAREQARELLAQRYAEDIIDLDAYEARIDAVERATDMATIESATGDLRPPEKETALAVPDSKMLVPASDVRDVQRVSAILGSTARSGSWDMPHHLHVRAIFGSTKLDLREARLPRAGAEIHVNVFAGEVSITVPPGMRVTVDGSAVLGEFDDETHTEPLTGIPPLRVTGTVVMGEVEIKERMPGESGWGAYWRRRRDRKRRRKELERRRSRGELPPSRD